MSVANDKEDVVPTEALSRPAKLAKRRRKLPSAPSVASRSQRSTHHGHQPEVKATIEERLGRLSPQVLGELKATEGNDKFMPGRVCMYMNTRLQLGEL